jgi:hypothetical protein
VKFWSLREYWIWTSRRSNRDNRAAATGPVAKKNGSITMRVGTNRGAWMNSEQSGGYLNLPCSDSYSEGNQEGWVEPAESPDCNHYPYRRGSEERES